MCTKPECIPDKAEASAASVYESVSGAEWSSKIYDSVATGPGPNGAGLCSFLCDVAGPNCSFFLHDGSDCMLGDLFQAAPSTFPTSGLIKDVQLDLGELKRFKGGVVVKHVLYHICIMAEANCTKDHM